MSKNLLCVSEKDENENDVMKKIIDQPVVMKIKWRNVLLVIYFHIEAFRGLYRVLMGQVMWQTIVFSTVLYVLSGLGITAGVHRLWSHRSYKVNLKLRVMLTFLNTVADQMSIIRWARDHRVHHKYVDTNADPYNARRGFFYAHMGWIMCSKHPAVAEAGKRIDITDLTNDKVLSFQHKYFMILMPLLCFAMPTYVSAYFWNETKMNGWLVAGCLRYILFLHATWSINSFAHMYGYKPYDKSITPVQSLFVSLTCLGEGWHNYHHVFPFDYRSDEFGSKNFNISAMFIELMEKIGWAYDLRTASDVSIRSRMLKTGSGAQPVDFWENFIKTGKFDWF